MTIDNDTRGWIMAGISGVACVAGASIICIDIAVRLFPGMHKFSISESNTFLSASLSLSFGVMLYSALYSMLPQSKQYLEDAGYSPRVASYMLIGLFLGGVIGIRLLSNIIHRFIPSHVVDCDHTHDEEEAKGPQDVMAEQHDQTTTQADGYANASSAETEEDEAAEDTPLLSRTSSAGIPPRPQRTTTAPGGSVSMTSRPDNFVTAPTSRRPSLFPRLSRTITKYVINPKDECDESGPCMGYSDPCGQECFKVIQKRNSTSITQAVPSAKVDAWQTSPSEYRFIIPEPIQEQSSEDSPVTQSRQDGRSRSTPDTRVVKQGPRSRSATHHYHHPEGDHHHNHSRTGRRASTHSHEQSMETTDHHHHVPTNAFMSIGLQTSLAIALHKAPEGFITYATNHANPTLGFAVFMALFIHNITEGFAMSLPLYLALNSRMKAIIWSAFLGGVSQPLGAGIAALWFKIAADSGKIAPDQGVYGCMFAITAGVMTSVALSLYSESLQLSHSKTTCIVYAFLGMAILGVSYALTAK